MRGLGLFLGVLTLVIVGCGELKSDGSGGTNYAEYNQLVESYNRLLRQNIESDKLLEATADLVKELDQIASEHRTLDLALRLTLIGTDATAMRTAAKHLRESTDKAYGVIARIENQISDINIERMKSNADRTMKYPELTKAHLELKRLLLRNLNGMQLLFSNDLNDAEVAVNERLKALKATPLAVTPVVKPLVDSVAFAGPTGNLAGVVYAPNRMDPVDRALVYAPVKTNPQIKAEGIQPNEKLALSCGEPKEAYFAKTCTDALGKFELRKLPEGKVNVTVKKGGFELRSEASVVANETRTIPKVDTTLPSVNSERGSVAKIAVVAGAYDNLEKVLAKLGLGDVDAKNRQYDFFQGRERGYDFISSPESLAKYELIMINCGAGIEDRLTHPEVAKHLRQWVEAGGRLYVTDLSYDFVEQLYPAAVNFKNDKGATEAGALGAAERGASISGETTASVASQSLQRWLRESVKCGDLNNPTRSCVLADGKSVSLMGFSGNWAVMDSVAASTTTWVEADIEGARRPLTITFGVGKGRVLFSSYHTFAQQPGSIFAQERILQYLVFELIQ